MIINPTRKRSGNQCTVSQLKQAAAYPLIITVFGKRNGWIENDIAEQWVTLTVDILFKMIIGRHIGLCNYVRKRYEKNKYLEIFDQVIGDGILWIAMSLSKADGNFDDTEKHLINALAKAWNVDVKVD